MYEGVDVGFKIKLISLAERNGSMYPILTVNHSLFTRQIGYIYDYRSNCKAVSESDVEMEELNHSKSSFSSICQDYLRSASVSVQLLP